jgi:hypothetical protein
MSCPERQITNLMESVTEAIRSAREDSGLTRDELTVAAHDGVIRAFRPALRTEPRPTNESPESELDKGLLLILHNFLEKGLSMGRLFNELHTRRKGAAPTIRSFNESVHNLQQAGLVIVSRPANGEATIRLSEPGIVAIKPA